LGNSDNHEYRYKDAGGLDLALGSGAFGPEGPGVKLALNFRCQLVLQVSYMTALAFGSWAGWQLGFNAPDRRCFA